MDTKSPTVVHLKRARGQIVQDCDVYVGRACNMGGWTLPNSVWANPYPVSKYGRDECIEMYKKYVLNKPELMAKIPSLAGKRLGCWCAPLKCHADVLVEIYLQVMQALPRTPK